jgi:predicted Rossmann fold nucleotide-binding protein DprA/Smf involved in DNA uptake
MISARAFPCLHLDREDPRLTPRIEAALVQSRSERLTMFGNSELLELPLLSLFATLRTPPDLILRSLDLARALRRAGVPVVAGFQTPLEREVLSMLLRGGQPTVVCPARCVEGMRIPRTWRTPLREGRLLILSPFEKRLRRPSVRLALIRNHVVTSLASRTLVIHARPGSRAFRTAAAALEAGTQVFCLDHPKNSDLILLGATPATASEIVAACPGE